MVNVECLVDITECRFVLRPNRSLSWQGMLLFFGVLCAVSGTIAIVLALLGFWPVLAFAVLEMIALGWGFYRVVQNSYRCEVISIDDQSVRIEKGIRYPERQWTLTRLWSRVVLERSAAGCYPSRLLIRSHGQAVEVGDFLNEQQRRQLASDLSRHLHQ